MSIKVPKETVEYQSHNHCQCDFCSSRRSVNAKKLSVSERAAQLQHAKNRNGCCCQCHDVVNASTFAASRHGGNSGFDSRYPAPVNQTALNASRGRNGTTTNGQSQNGTATLRTKEEEERDSMAELDRLERLLILEHKARINATLEADRMGTLRDAKDATSHGPQPLPAGYMSGSALRQQQQFGGNSYTESGMYPGASYDSANVETIREAYELAHQCPVTPPVQCHSSHRLQDTMNDIRAVTMDPVNPAGRDRLQQVLHANGLGDAPSASSAYQKAHQSMGGVGVDNEFGNSLAKNRTSNPHPHGAGVLWVDSEKQRLASSGNSGATSLSPGAAAAIATNPQHADGHTVATKTVTYAL